MDYEYQIIPLALSVEFQNSSPEKAARKTQDLVNTWAGMGWEYCRMETVPIHVSAGCLAIFVHGAKNQTVHYPQLVFRRVIEVRVSRSVPTKESSAPKAEQAARYYYMGSKPQPEGPVSKEVLLDLCRTRQLSHTSLICKAGTEEWKPLNQVLSL